MSIKIIEGTEFLTDSRIGVVVARWNSMITEKMLKGALKSLKANGINENNIIVARCPGAYEIPLAVQHMLENNLVDGVVAIGVVIRGGTPHFEYVCDAVNMGITNLILKYNKPVGFGVLTTDTVAQAVERAGDKGNKGGEAALAVLEMLALGRNMKQLK